MTRLDDAVEIAKLAEMGLTGGEIRLVIERAVRLQAYRGLSSMNHKTLREIAEEEVAARMTRDGNTAKIGFAVGAAARKGEEP